jgi:hypothetical protein
MGFASDSGYTPSSIETIIDSIRSNINTQFGTTYTTETFLGTNFYKYIYALAQRVQQNEIKTSEIFASLEKYFEITNERIQRPVATNPGLSEAFENYRSTLFPSGIVASVKPMIDADAGKINICVNVDSADPNYAAMKLEINTLIKNSTAAGAVTQGTETSTIVLTNGQPFDFKYRLPNVLTTKLRLTTTLSDNNQVVVGTPEEVKQKLLDNIAAKYRLGMDFEPQRYFTTADAPWTSAVLLEYSTDGGGTYASTIYDANYNDLFSVSLANVTIVEN